MSSNSPWETSDNFGASLEGTMTADRASGPSYMDMLQPPPELPPPGMQGPAQPGAFATGMSDQASKLEMALASLGRLQAGKVAQQAQAQEPPPLSKLVMKSDGTFSAEGSQQLLAELMGQQKDLQTMKAAAMARVAQLRQQEASGSPLIDALSQFAGNMAANDPTMPGWVRALGATNLAMGPQGIKRERMMEENRAMQFGQQESALAQQLLKNQQTDRGLDIQELSAIGNLQNRSISQQNQHNTALDAVTKDIESLAKYGSVLTPDAIAKRASLRGITDPAEVKTLTEYYGAAKKAVDDAKAEAERLHLDEKQKEGWITLALKETFAKSQNERMLARAEALSTFRAENQLRIRKEMSEFNEGQKSLAPLRVLSQPDQTMLHDMATNLEYLKQLKNVVNDPKTSQFLGPLNLARISGEWSTLFRPDELQTVMTYYAHELPRVAKFTGAQSRAFTAAMVPVIKSLGGETSMTPSQMNNVIKIIEESTQQVQSGIAKGKPLAPFHLAPDLLGGVDSPVYKKWVKTHENALKQSGANPSAGAPDEAKRAREAAVGSVVTIGGRNFKKTGANNFEPFAGGQ